MKQILIAVLILNSVLCFSGEDKIFFIVHKNNPVSKLNRHQISDYFLKKNRTWSDGEPVRFFDRIDGSKERKRFLNSVLLRTSREIDSFWIGQKLFSGDSAPVQVESDQMIINLVSRFPGAIGFVTSLPEGNTDVKAIEFEDSRP